MRVKSEIIEGLCYAAQCLRSSSIVIHHDGQSAIELCDQHWQGRCNDAEREYLERQDMVVADLRLSAPGGLDGL